MISRVQRKLNYKKKGLKKIHNIGVNVALVCIVTILCSTMSFAKETFTVNKDKSIVVGENHFVNMHDYVSSDYFRDNEKRCGTTRPVDAIDQEMTRSLNDCTLQMTRIQNEYWLSGVIISIPVWIHVMYRADGLGNISDTDINAQLEVLNEDFRALAGTLGAQGNDTRIEFTLAGVTRTQNNTWFSDNDVAGYTSSLNRDPFKYVNVYINTASGYLGYTFFPQQTAGSNSDRIVLNYSAVGGRNNGYMIYNQGRTLVHEMGHYLGLYHTFGTTDTCGNSYSSGDLIVDTASENGPHYNCTQENSCGTPDPINNYMNFTPDSCMKKFTLEQANRMICSLVNYRPGMNVKRIDGSIISALGTLLLEQ